MIKTVFIGNRPKIFEALLTHPLIDLIKVFSIDQHSINSENFGDKIELIAAKGERKKVVNFLKESNYQLCVSAGCSYVLPMSELPNDRTFINCHPSALPLGKGIHPLNECFLSNHQTAGVSIHYLTDELDAGDIIEQISFPVTDDLDVSLLYGFIFDLEAELLIKSINRLIENNMSYIGNPQIGIGTYYSRSSKLASFCADEVTCDIFLKNVQAFSSNNLGVLLKANMTTYKVFSAKKLSNQFILNRFVGVKIGDECIKTKDVVVIRLTDGLVRLNSWVMIEVETYQG